MRKRSPASTMSCIDALGSISIADRFVNPLTFVASLPNFCENASERLCAGSVELISGASVVSRAKLSQQGETPAGRDSHEQHRLSNLCELDRERARSRGFADSA